MSVSSARVAESTRVHGGVALGAVVALVAVAAISGLVLGGALKAAPRQPGASELLSGAGIRVRLPAGWEQGGAPVVAGLDRALSVHAPSTGVRAAIGLLPAASPTLLPTALRHTGAAPATVRLASGYAAWRYQHSGLLVYATPTTKGVATVACRGTASGVCERLASSITVPGARRLEIGRRAGFFSGLAPVVSTLAARRSTGARNLDAATSPTEQALAAAALARAHAAAASRLDALAGPGDRLPAATIDDLTALASAYTALARAARNRIPRPYAKAGRAVARADAELRRTLATVTAAVNAATAAAPARPAARPPRRPATATTPAAARAPSGAIDLTFPLLALFAAAAIAVGWRVAREQ